MSDNIDPQTTYDVFVSFRGKDIRRGFLSHLREAFERNQINAFIDDQLERGNEIWPSLVGAIKGSSISLIIFSQGYASSRWCLKELVKILKHKEEYGQIVIPIFYEVEPTHVGHQSSESYKNAFDEHKTKYETTKVQKWRDALNKSAKISGIESSKFLDDAKLLEEIVKLVMMRMGKLLVNSKGIVGIEKKIADVESLIRREPKDTRLIGIWGMGGIGKTTLAQEVFNNLRSEYQGSYFLANEREQSRKTGISSLKKEIFTELLGHAPNSFYDDRIRRMKVLIVLDDMNDFGHLSELLGPLENFGSGSTIIVTTRDKQVLNANKADDIYQLGEFSFDKALELFKLNAFNQSDHPMEYDDLLERVVNYAQGIPLVVKVLARRLCGKDKEVWESELDKLGKMPLRKVYHIMKLSYDDLDREEQQIFLDLACFFLRLHRKLTVGYLKSLLRNGESDNSVVAGLDRLKDKALITFSKDNFVSMHDSLQEMAWEIVCQESMEDPGSHRLLWIPDDVCEALKNDKGTLDIRSIVLHLPRTKKQKLSLHILAKMSRLRFLEISGQDEDDRLNDNQHKWLSWLKLSWPKQQKAWSDDIVAKGLKFWTSELIFLSWEYYPLKSLPENFSCEKLVILELQRGNVKKLWDGVKNLVNLKEVDLSYSQKLKELPDLSKATNLEVLLLKGCSRLTSVHPSVFSLPKLEILNLSSCESLTKIGRNSHLCSLTYLNLEWCKNLREFSLISENMEELILDGTKVKALRSSFGHLSKLKSLHLFASDIERLPSSINNLTQLLYLHVEYCRKLHTIPELPLSLETLDARGCISLKSVLFPSTAVEQLKENRKRVEFWNCLKLDEVSLVAIGLNAQINVMKFANHHLSAPIHDHVQNYRDYNPYDIGSYQRYYVYPGSSVPEWLEYKTTEKYINIDLSYAPPSPKLGFIFCFVIGQYPFNIETFAVDISISDDEGEGKKDSITMYIAGPTEETKSDHVCVMYDQRCSDFLNSIAKNQTIFTIQVTLREIGLLPEDRHALVKEVLKGFGVSPMSSSVYNSFIQQIELR